MSARRHRFALLAVMAFLVVLTTAILSEVLGTVFFAVTVAYVLYPLREQVAERGASPRVASGAAALTGLLVVVLLVLPLVVILYRRRGALLALLRDLPAELTVDLGAIVYVVDTVALTETLRQSLGRVAVSLARTAPVLALKLFLFVFLVYGLLLRPRAVSDVVADLVPATYHDIVNALHERVRDTLYAIYVLQAATAFATFVAALAMFLLLGYRSAVSLAVIAGVLQFVPIVGPSVLVVLLGGYDFAFGDPSRALAVLALGLVLVGFLPDALVRPRLAQWTTRLPATVYFVGFTGGVLSLGAVGFVAGPLVVAVLVEAVELVSAEP